MATALFLFIYDKSHEGKLLSLKARSCSERIKISGRGRKGALIYLEGLALS
jgi:hypothetical protein